MPEIMGPLGVNGVTRGIANVIYVVCAHQCSVDPLELPNLDEDPKSFDGYSCGQSKASNFFLPFWALPNDPENSENHRNCIILNQ
jgi:hypothetical protein